MEKLIKKMSETYLYQKGDYNTPIIDAVMKGERINVLDKSFEDVLYEVRTRQVTLFLSKVVVNPNIVLYTLTKPLPKALKVLPVKDIRTGEGTKIFIDCTDILINVGGKWKCQNITVLIARLMSASVGLIYNFEPNKILMNTDVSIQGAVSFAKMFTNIINYIFKINTIQSQRDKCMYLSAMYYLVNLLRRDPEAEGTKQLARKVANLSATETDIIDIYMDSDSYNNINTFTNSIAKVLKIEKLRLDTIVEKWSFIYGSGTHFGLELFLSFSDILTSSYIGGFIYQQKSIDTIVGENMIEYTKALMRIGSSYFGISE